MDKPFLTFDEQIDKLKTDYNLTINNYEFAIEALSSLSYYDLINGYQFIYKKNNKYHSGVTIEQLVSTHIFNKNIQGVLLKYSTYVENSFKTILSHTIGQNFTVDQQQYLNINNYKKLKTDFHRQKLRKVLTAASNTCKTCNDTPTKYYRINKNHVPPWILLRNMSFSDSTDIFYFLKKKEKECFFSFYSILNTDFLDFEDKVNVMFTSLNLVRIFRNKIAHNLDFLTHRRSSLDKSANLLFKDSLVLTKELNKTRNDVWAMILSIVLLLNNKYLIQNFLAELNSFMKYEEHLIEMYCDVAGIPIDFEQRINWYLSSLIL